MVSLDIISINWFIWTEDQSAYEFASLYASVIIGGQRGIRDISFSEASLSGTPDFTLVVILRRRLIMYGNSGLFCAVGDGNRQFIWMGMTILTAGGRGGFFNGICYIF